MEVGRKIINWSLFCVFKGFGKKDFTGMFDGSRRKFINKMIVSAFYLD
jgi:hypothetical protein